LLRDAGVSVAFGNDAAYGFCVHSRPVDELLAMARAGMSAAEVLAAATTGAAALLACDDRGALAPGQRADLIVAAGDARTDLACLERVDLVVASGRVVPSDVRAATRRALAARLAVARGVADTATGAAARAFASVG
jgi:imidazolonepropionase-like amidohydrolase